MTTGDAKTKRLTVDIRVGKEAPLALRVLLALNCNALPTEDEINVTSWVGSVPEIREQAGGKRVASGW